MELIKYPNKDSWNTLLKRPTIDTNLLEHTVQSVLTDVQQNGQSAVRRYTMQFDKVSVENALVTADEFLEAEKTISSELKKAIQLAKNNIELFHAAQKEDVKIIETAPGVMCWRKSIAIEKVGLYIPGGSAPLFSTILMLGIPAKLAGCKEIVLCTPPNSEGKINDAILSCQLGMFPMR